MQRSLPNAALPHHAAAADLEVDDAASGRRRDHRSRNAGWFRALAGSTSDSHRLHWRNALVEANLGLVRQVAGRLRPRTGLWPGLSFDDLLQIGTLGLIRAIDAFDSRRGVSLSSFAVPYIRGAIAHELRDRGTLLRAPRPLWDLRQRATALQQGRRSQGKPPLDATALATELGCRPEVLAEALDLGRLVEARSLDAPLPGRGEREEAQCLLDLLPAAANPSGDGPADDDELLSGQDRSLAAQQRWFKQELAQLDPPMRLLLTGRLLMGCTWVELGGQLGMHPRMAQRRCLATLARLQAAAQERGAQERAAKEGVSRNCGETLP